MNAAEIYAGSDGEATKALYDRLEGLGDVGMIALNLFRACKASERAKKYRRRYKGLAYEKKNWSLNNLCDALVNYHGPWGWEEDPTQEFHKFVLYISLPNGQVSFHSATQLSPERYYGHWDGEHKSAERIIAFVQSVLDGKPVDHPHPRLRRRPLPSKGEVEKMPERRVVERPMTTGNLFRDQMFTNRGITTNS